MGKVYLSLFLAAVVLAGGMAEPARAEEAASAERTFDAPERIAKKRFTYLITWNSIPVGRIIAEVGGVIRTDERELETASLVTESNEFLSKIYRVEDTYITYVDPAAKTSVKYVADRKEGSYRKHQVVEFDAKKRLAKYVNLTDGSVKYCEIPKDVHDPLSAALCFMTMPVRLGDKVRITVNLNEKNYELYGMIESLETLSLRKMGSFEAFKVRPYAILGGKKVKKGHGYLYFSADDRRYPLYGVLWIPFGKVTASLRSVEEIG